MKMFHDLLLDLFHYVLSDLHPLFLPLIKKANLLWTVLLNIT